MTCLTLNRLQSLMFGQKQTIKSSVSPLVKRWLTFWRTRVRVPHDSKAFHQILDGFSWIASAEARSRGLLLCLDKCTHDMSELKETAIKVWRSDVKLAFKHSKKTRIGECIALLTVFFKNTNKIYVKHL